MIQTASIKKKDTASSKSNLTSEISMALIKLTGFSILLLIFIIFSVDISITYAEKITVTDMADRVVVIPHQPKRIVTSFKPATLCLFALGLEKKIVGIDNSSKRDKLHRAVMPQVVNITGVGSKTTGLNFETTISLRPDLVILYAQKDGISLAGKFQMMNIPAIIILPESFNSIRKSLEIIAKAAGVGKRAEIVENAMNSVLNLVKIRLRNLPADERKTGYFASPRGLFNTATGNMLQDKIFKKAGIINVAHNLNGYFQDISPEQMIKWNPDVIIISQHSGPYVFRQLRNPAIRTITAVRTKNMYRFPGNLAPWDFPSPLSALGVLWLADKIYPELFKNIDINKEINLFHKTLFGKTFTQMNGKINARIRGVD